MLSPPPCSAFIAFNLRRICRLRWVGVCVQNLVARMAWHGLARLGWAPLGWVRLGWAGATTRTNRTTRRLGD